ncbi:MAG: hypothetical protein R3F11_28490 [Verrucomicrobiales bacterium]
MRISSPILALSLALLASNCSSYQPKWRAAQAEYPVPRGDILGAWEGRWHSDWNDHSGRLKLVVERQPGTGDPEDHSFHYWATWGPLSADYTAVLTLEPAGAGKWKLSGTKDLGALYGGTYSHEGTATPERIHSNYRAENGDHGTFELTRPIPAATAAASYRTEKGRDAAQAVRDASRRSAQRTLRSR